MFPTSRSSRDQQQKNLNLSFRNPQKSISKDVSFPPLKKNFLIATFSSETLENSRYFKFDTWNSVDETSFPPNDIHGERGSELNPLSYLFIPFKIKRAALNLAHRRERDKWKNLEQYDVEMGGKRKRKKNVGAEEEEEEEDQQRYPCSLKGRKNRTSNNFRGISSRDPPEIFPAEIRARNKSSLRSIVARSRNSRPNLLL